MSARPAEAVAALAGPVRSACDVRLACLALALLAEAARRPPRAAVVVALVLALPLSYIPLRAWERVGPRLVSSVLLAGADLAVALWLLLALRFQAPAAVYAGTTVLLTTMVLGAGAGVTAVLGVTLAHGAGVLVGAPVLPATAAVQVSLTAVVAYVGLRLRLLLLERTTLRRDLDAAQLESARSAERARLAREMHDSLSKTLHGVQLLAGSLERRLRRESHPRAADADEIARAAELARRDARTLIADLRELPVDDLPDFLLSVAGRAREMGLDVALTVRGDPPRLGVGATYEVAKAVDELVDNVLRHAGARRLRLALEVERGWALLEVRDDGVGLPVDPDLTSLQRSGHFGLVGVHERVARAGGSVVLRPVDRGTSVLLRVPLADEPEGESGDRRLDGGSRRPGAVTRSDA